LDGSIDSVREWLNRTEDSSTTEVLLETLVALNRFWRVASRQSEGIEWYDRVLAKATGHSSLPVAQAFESRGYLLRDSGDYAQAADSFHAALAGYQHSGEQTGASRAHNSLGALASDLGNTPEARFHAEAALVLQRASEDHWGIARSLHNLGWIAIEEGNTEEADSLFHQSAVLWSETGDIDSHGRALNSLGALTSMQGQYDAATAHYLQSVALYRQIGAGYLLAESLSDMAAVEIAMRRYNEAAASLLECLTIYQEVGIRFRFVEAIETVASLALGLNRFSLAHRFLEAASALRDASGLPPLVTWSGRLHEWQSAVARALGNSSARDELKVASSAQALTEALDFVRGLVDRQTVRSTTLSGLSRRELEILQLISQGLSDQEIAAQLFISKRTASNHVASILQKLDVPSRAAAAVTATKAGII
ncbi:MAG: tetratricopeptide repeat protein, partial [Thermomicrobiales bacterium]